MTFEITDEGGHEHLEFQTLQSILPTLILPYVYIQQEWTSYCNWHLTFLSLWPHCKPLERKMSYVISPELSSVCDIYQELKSHWIYELSLDSVQQQRKILGPRGERYKRSWIQLNTGKTIQTMVSLSATGKRSLPLSGTGKRSSEFSSSRNLCFKQRLDNHLSGLLERRCLFGGLQFTDLWLFHSRVQASFIWEKSL